MGLTENTMHTWWGRRDCQIRLHKNELLGHQISKRGSVMRVRVGDKRVFLGGKAVTILHAELHE
ncbi:MAG: hypothetical protein ABSC50_09800 [Candidatus Bathyarchaeia archaeon]